MITISPSNQKSTYLCFVDTNILDLVLEEMQYHSIWSDEDYPINGFHIKPRPKDCRIEAVEINHLMATYDEQTGVRGIVNINVFHEDILRINMITDILRLIFDNTLIDVAYMELDRDPHLFRQSKRLFFNNLRYEYTIDKKHIKYKDGEFEIVCRPSTVE